MKNADVGKHMFGLGEAIVKQYKQKLKSKTQIKLLLLNNKLTV